MKRVPPLPPARLRRLQELAQMKADAELARLAVTAQGRSRLLAALSALGRAEPPLGPNADAPPQAGQAAALEPMLVRARLAHAAWIETRRRDLNARLAMIQADWLRLQPVAARAHARAQVLDRLTVAAEGARRHRTQVKAADG